FSPILTHSILSLIATPSTSTYTLSLHDALPIFSMVFTDMATGLQHHRSGALRGLATTRLQRSALVPELPTLDEAGVTGFDMDSWAGFFLPANTPRDIVTRLNTELRKIIDNPEVK